MELQLCTKQQSVDLKEIGFDWVCKDFFHINIGCTVDDLEYLHYMDNGPLYQRPTMALAIKWLREIKKIFISPRLGYENGKENWLFCMHLENYTPLSFDNIHFEQEMWAQYNYKNYEEAESAGLDAALKYLKSNKAGE
jgi:hypothetical protein